jgi:hypothetical protein
MWMPSRAYCPKHSRGDDMANRTHPGSEWRVLAHDGAKKIECGNEGIFDELVVDDWLHIEQLDDASWWMRVGDARILVRAHEGGTRVDVERGFYAEVLGTTAEVKPTKYVFAVACRARIEPLSVKNCSWRGRSRSGRSARCLQDAYVGGSGWGIAGQFAAGFSPHADFQNMGTAISSGNPRTWNQPRSLGPGARE